MTNLVRKALTGNIHRVREFELEKVSLAEEFDILQIVGEGWFGKILLVEHKATDTEMVLKALPKPYVALRDFYREFHYGLHLGQHRNVITTYDVAFETAGFYVFSQEYAPLGDLTSNVSENGIGELHSKRVAKQVAAALDHLHAKDLVHRDVKLDNVLVFKSDFSRVKLCDFGETRKTGTVVQRRNEWLPYSPPEVLRTETDNTYKAETSHDVWQFGIVVFVCLTGCLPWQKAAPDDPRFVRYNIWHSSTIPIRRQPKLFKMVTSRAQRMFRRFLEPKAERRPQGLGDLHKYLEDRWLSKGGMDKSGSGDVDELCPSMYSFHSSLEEKNKLLHTLTQYGIETTVDRGAKKDRIRDWIQSSVIAEVEDEEEEDDEHTITQVHAGHFPSVLRAPVETQLQRFSTLRDSEKKHINPRTGEILQKENSETNSNGRLPATGNTEPNRMSRSISDSAYGSTDFKNSAPSSPLLSRNASLRSESGNTNATATQNIASGSVIPLPTSSNNHSNSNSSTLVRGAVRNSINNNNMKTTNDVNERSALKSTNKNNENVGKMTGASLKPTPSFLSKNLPFINNNISKITSFGSAMHKSQSGLLVNPTNSSTNLNKAKSVTDMKFQSPVDNYPLVLSDRSENSVNTSGASRAATPGSTGSSHGSQTVRTHDSFRDLADRESPYSKVFMKTSMKDSPYDGVRNMIKHVK